MAFNLVCENNHEDFKLPTLHVNAAFFPMCNGNTHRTDLDKELRPITISRLLFHLSSFISFGGQTKKVEKRNVDFFLSLSIWAN